MIILEIFEAVDTAVLEWLYSIRTVEVSQSFIAISEYGRYEIIFMLTAALGAWLLLRNRLADCAGLLLAVCSSGALILTLKLVTQRSRPDIFYQAYIEGPYLSFPSAHAGLAMAFYGYVLYLLLQEYPTRMRQIAIVFLPILIVLVSFSRLYLGVHFVSDVITGMTIGFVFIMTGVQMRLWALSYLERKRV